MPRSGGTVSAEAGKKNGWMVEPIQPFVFVRDMLQQRRAVFNAKTQSGAGSLCRRMMQSSAARRVRRNQKRSLARATVKEGIEQRAAYAVEYMCTTAIDIDVAGDRFDAGADEFLVTTSCPPRACA